MKAHIGVDAKSGGVDPANVTTGKVHGAKVIANLIREGGRAVFGEKGYGSGRPERKGETGILPGNKSTNLNTLASAAFEQILRM